MRAIALLAIILIALPTTAAYTLAPAPTRQGGEGGGDWVIDRDIVIENTMLRINRSVIVKPGARLTIANSVIYMESGYSGQLSIRVERGGELRVVGSTIKSGTGKAFLVYVYGTLVMIHSTLMHCGIKSDKPGLVIEGSSFSLIQDSVIKAGYAGVTIRGSRNIEVSGNRIYGNFYGLYIAHSSGIVVRGNMFASNNYDLYSYNSTSLVIEGNTFSGGGVFLDRNTLGRIIGNRFNNTGIMLSGGKPMYYRHYISGNMVNGRPLVYIYNATDRVVRGPIGGAIIASSRNIVLQGVSVSGGLIGVGIYFSRDITINGSTIKNASIGVEAKYSSSITLANTRIEGSRMYGLKLYNTTGVSIVYSSITGSRLTGILVMDSRGVRINYNNLTGNPGFGVYAEGSSLVDASLNWWGSSSGPEYTRDSNPENPEELYFENTGGSKYEPWLAEPPSPGKTPIVYTPRGGGGGGPWSWAPAIAGAVAAAAIAAVLAWSRRARAWAAGLIGRIRRR